MRVFLRQTALILLLMGLSLNAGAKEPWQDWITEAQFRTLCETLSHRVAFFEKIWGSDADAQLYGGTSRDFVWLVRGELAKATDREDLWKRVHALEARAIDVKELVVGQSDVDVISAKDLATVDYDRSMLTKIEAIDPAWFKPGSKGYVQEALQGYIPVEKIRLGQKGFARAEGLEYGDGVGEIYRGYPTLRFDPRIEQTEMYRNKGNHPILLALRYLRQVAVAYYRIHGREYPKLHDLLALVDPASREALEGILSKLKEDPDSLNDFLANFKFREFSRARPSRIRWETIFGW